MRSLKVAPRALARVAFGEGVGARGRATSAIVAGDADDDLVCPDDRRERLGAVEDQVGIGREERRVLVRRRLALHGVDDDDLVVTAVLAKWPGLDGGGKGGAAPSRQTRGLEFVRAARSPVRVAKVRRGAGRRARGPAQQPGEERAR